MVQSPRFHAFFGLLALLLLVASVGGLAGCDRTAELAETKSSRPGHFTATDSAAADVLERSAAAYRRLLRYSDAGRVVLTYKVDGETAQDVAPLAVAFERPNRLGIKAYQVTAGTSENRFRMRLTSDTSSPLRSQVVSRARPERIDTSWLMIDSVAAEHLAAGLAGPPPQLDLLLGDQPFRTLLDGSADVSLDGQGAERGKTFHIVKVMRGEAKTRLWIDSQSSLLRRIELPTASLPPGMLQDQRISDIHLSIELDDAAPDDEISWSDWQVPSQALDQPVRYFVAPPEVALDPRLGKTVPAFRLAAVAGEGEVDTSRPAADVRIQMLVWLADHPSCRATVQQIGQALAALPENVRSRIAPAAVWAEPNAPAGTTFANLAEKWEIAMPIVIDKDALGRDLLGVAEAPTIVILDSQHRLQFFQERAHPLLAQALPDLLRRLVDGESLATVMTENARAEQERFVAQLWLARAGDAAPGAFAVPKPYGPQTVRLSQPKRQSSPSTIVVMNRDAQHNLWVLKADGQLECLDSSGKPQATFDTDWKMAARDQPALTRLAIDGNAKFVAAHGQSASELSILDVSSRKASTVSLGAGQIITDFRWMETPQGSRLAAITDAGRTVLIDPVLDQQLSGQSPGRPIALLEASATGAGASGYVILADGRIEPVVEEGRGTAMPAVAAKPVSTGGAAVVSPVVQRQLKFVPAAGPWSIWHGNHTSATLARGLVARDDPAVFLLDDQLRQVWHAPLPISDGGDGFLASVADDPVSGQPLWVVSQPAQTLHFFRVDGNLVDHCQFPEPIRGLALVPSGNELHLWIAHPNSLDQYRIQ